MTPKHSAIARSPAVLLLILALPLHLANAEEDSVLGDIWALYGAVNYSSWDGLGDVEPVGRGGPFPTDGIGIEVGFPKAHIIRPSGET